MSDNCLAAWRKKTLFVEISVRIEYLFWFFILCIIFGSVLGSFASHSLRWFILLDFAYQHQTMLNSLEILFSLLP